MRMLIVAAIACTTSATTMAHAHDEWASGERVPGWVKEQCCGPDDAHHLTPSQVHVTPLGYRVDGYRQIIPERVLLPSSDGEWWIFYRDFESGDQSQVYCFFGPPQGS